MDFKDKQAIYLQIAEYVSEQILLSKWPPGDRIPSVRDLGAELEVNPNTVVRTYDYLQQKAVIYNKRGLGYFAADDAVERVRALRREQFLETALPDFFRNLYLLNIGLDEIERRYQAFLSQQYPASLSN